MACDRLQICGKEGTIPGKRTMKRVGRPDQNSHSIIASETEEWLGPSTEWVRCNTELVSVSAHGHL